MSKFSGAIRHVPKFRGAIIRNKNIIPVFPPLLDFKMVSVGANVLDIIATAHQESCTISVAAKLVE